MINWGTVPLGAVLPFPFATYGKTNGESITLTGLATTDIEVYKGTSVTQRASDAGYALIDTDGIDIDTTTGIHGFSIDTGDNTDAGFFVAGSFYWVVVSAVTVDSQTVNFIAGTFSLRAAESVAGVIEVDVTHAGGTAITVASGIPEVKVASIANNAITAASINADAITDAKVASDVTIASVTGAVGSVTGAVGSVTGAVGSVTAGVTVTTNNDKTGYRLDAVGSAALTEDYAALGAAGSIAELLYEIRALLAEKAVSGTTLTAKKLDGSTTAATYTLDDATTPTAITRAS